MNRWGPHGAAERREKYYSLRDDGLTPLQAAYELDVSLKTAERYERWYQVVLKEKAGTRR